MADNLHKTMALDDKLESLISDIQHKVAKLHDLTGQFEKLEHKPTKSQIKMIESTASYLKQVAEVLEMQK